MLLFASDIWVTILTPANFMFVANPTVYVGGKLFNLGQDPSKCTYNVLQYRMVVLSPLQRDRVKILSLSKSF
jgi:hypothetical protein